MAYRLFDAGAVLAESADFSEADTFFTEATIFNRNFQLHTYPLAGWLAHTVELQDVASLGVPKPVWEAPLMALGVMCAVALGAAILAMRVQKTLHQTLLQVSRGNRGQGNSAS
jgi:hypothetical protein